MATTLLSNVPAKGRIGRYPKHNFLLYTERPFSAVPFMLSPVLPGETLKSIFMEARSVTDPVLNPIIGWKKEFYFFYVRITDLLNNAIRDMFVDPTNTDLTATLGVAVNSTPFYTAKGGIDWTKRCLEQVMVHYFRDEGEAWNAPQNDLGVPIVQIRDQFWMDSMTDKDLMPEGPAIATATDAGDLDRLMDAFEQLRALGIANMTYEDFLRSYGINIPEKDEGKPELIGRFSDYQYPSNTINPSNGAPTSAVSWVFKNGNKEKKFFKEPGFIIGVTVTRPKVYFSGLAGSAAGFMGRAWDWMPNYLAAVPETSLKNFAGDTGPLGDRTTAPDGYWIDMRDVLLYGDQWHDVGFQPVPATAGTYHLLALPTGDTFNSKYPDTAMTKSFFVDNAGTATRVKSDGYVSLGIDGAQVDYTKGRWAEI